MKINVNRDYILLEKLTGVNSSGKKPKPFNLVNDEQDIQFGVYEVGPDVSICKKGDIVLCTYKGQVIEVNGDEFILVSNSDIIGVLTNE